MSVYQSGEITRQLDTAQAMIDRHTAADAGGRCLTCHEPEPCRAREGAHVTFVTYGRLPRRHRGIAMPWFLREERKVMSTAVIRLGEQLRFREHEYRYGVGDLLIRVTQIMNDSIIANWIEIKGIEICSNGAQGTERRVWVAQPALGEARVRAAST